MSDLKNDLFLRACMKEPVERTPVWMMRQAGRYLEEYRATRAKAGGFLDLCKNPELACEVTLQPIDILGADAAILFSDILVVPEAMGMELTFGVGEGPRFPQPIESRADVDRLPVPDPEDALGYVMAAVRTIRKGLDGRVPLIGFTGSPWTLATYMVEGGGSKNFSKVKAMAFNDPATMHLLLEKLADAVAAYLNAQIANGAQAVQIFDTWGGILAPVDYQKYILPYTKKLIDGLDRKGIPVIHFVKGSGTMLELVKQAGSDVVGLDWHVGLAAARDVLGPQVAVQGNLDPTVLYAPKAHIEREVKRILDENAGRPGHIFNLGHGILPTADPEHARFMVEAVHRLSRK